MTVVRLFARRSRCLRMVLMRVMPIVLRLQSSLMAAVAGGGTPHELHRQQYDEEDDQDAMHESMLAVGFMDW